MSEESEEGVIVLWQGGSCKSESCQELQTWRGKVVSTLDGPIWSRCTIALTCPARSHFQHTQSRERWDQGWNERYYSLRGEEGGDEEGQEKKKRKQATDFEEAVCCPSVVVEGAA